MNKNSISVHLGDTNFTSSITNGKHRIMGDEPTDIGGQDQGLSPYDLVIAGLALCKAATMRMYAQRKGWETGDIQVDIDLEIAKDAAPKFITRISLTGNLDAEQQQRLLQIADKCPTHKLLTNDKIFETHIL